MTFRHFMGCMALLRSHCEPPNALLLRLDGGGVYSKVWGDTKLMQTRHGLFPKSEALLHPSMSIHVSDTPVREAYQMVNATQ